MMETKNFIKKFRIAKIVQFVLLLLIEIVFFLILLSHPSMTRELYGNRPLFFLCAVVWVLIIFQLLCLLYDAFKLRSFAKESHTLRRLAYLDGLTGIPNRHGLDTIFRTYDTPQSMAEIGCCMLTIENLPEINERLGRVPGDAMIQDFCSILEKVGDSFGIVGRNGGNVFLAVIDNCGSDTIQRFCATLQEELEQYNRKHEQTPLLVRSAYVLNSEAKLDTFPRLLTATYSKLYKEG